MRFHDGSSLDAAAVVTSFRRLINPNSALAATGKFAPVIASVEAVDSAMSSSASSDPMRIS